jgi:hypothetical protein
MSGIATMDEPPKNDYARQLDRSRIRALPMSKRTPPPRLVNIGRRAEAVDKAREERIRIAAYYRALKRGFAPGHEWADWFAAEEEERSHAER